MSGNNFSVNGSMIPYYGRQGTKQFIRGLRFGFNLWCLCFTDGYLLHAELYRGKDTNLPEAKLGEGSDVAFIMIEKCDLTKWSTVTIDNLFTTLPILNKLTDMGMYKVDAVRENSLQGAPLKRESVLQKETRGIFDYTSDGNNFLVAWRDNSSMLRCVVRPT